MWPPLKVRGTLKIDQTKTEEPNVKSTKNHNRQNIAILTYEKKVKPIIYPEQIVLFCYLAYSACYAIPTDAGVDRKSGQKRDFLRHFFRGIMTKKAAL